MQNVVNCLWEDTCRFWKAAMIKCLQGKKLWFWSCVSDFLPWCIRCRNKDIDHHSVTHVKAMLHCPSERERVTKSDFGKILGSSEFPDTLWTKSLEKNPTYSLQKGSRAWLAICSNRVKGGFWWFGTMYHSSLPQNHVFDQLRNTTGKHHRTLK